MFHTKDNYQIVKFMSDENKLFDSLAMLEDAINYQQLKQLCLNFVHICINMVTKHTVKILTMSVS